ncbi:hypothetical protein [Dactylosporangium sp. CA-139066]|uniref:hypothetical protein n=1 Tax=Dactylosporangium sp. CA-139066 TaxID=3239930 RepID=UPI003D8B07B2
MTLAITTSVDAVAGAVDGDLRALVARLGASGDVVDRAVGEFIAGVVGTAAGRRGERSSWSAPDAGIPR